MYRLFAETVAYYFTALIALSAVTFIGAVVGVVEPVDGKGGVVLAIGAVMLLLCAALQFLVQAIKGAPGIPRMVLAGASTGIFLVPGYLLSSRLLDGHVEIALIVAAVAAFLGGWAVNAFTKALQQ